MKYIKNIDKPIQKYRFYIQSIFVLLCLWIAYDFYYFVEFLESGGTAEFTERPPGAEGFLPISALMSVYYFVLTGNIHQAHPAGFFILIAIVSVSFLFGKSFCSWICPVGFLSELIGDFGDKIQKKLFKKIRRIPRWLDYPLRSLKYLLLAFFINAIFLSMTTLALKAFLDSPYNIVADVKMWYFFADISKTSLIVIGVLFLLSIPFRNFWCRYLCPYGALLGLTSLLSPNKIKRNTDTCIDCNLCAKACPSNIKVDKVKTVWSDECSTCMSCVDSCPVKDALELKSIATKQAVPKKFVVVGIATIFFLILGIAKITDNWYNKIPQQQYLMIHKNINSLGHPRSSADINRLNEAAVKKQNNQLLGN